MNLKLHLQPTGNSCGPTCLYMINQSYMVNKPYMTHNPTIEEIYEICGTDWVVGTPPDRMEKGMEALKIKYVEHMASPRPFELLDLILKDGNIAILRTITKGVPHWIIVQSKTPMLYNILDPWQGEIQYYQPDLDAIWKPRDYQFFEIIQPIIYSHAEGYP